MNNPIPNYLAATRRVDAADTASEARAAVDDSLLKRQVAVRKAEPAFQLQRTIDVMKQRLEALRESLLTVSAETAVEVSNIDDVVESLRMMMETEISKVRAASEKQINDLRSSLDAQTQEHHRRRDQATALERDRLEAIRTEIAACEAYLATAAKPANHGVVDA